MSLTSQFIKNFDPKNKTHIEWFSHMIVLAGNMVNPESRVNLVAEINKNPMNIIVSTTEALDWPHIHFVLCATYSLAVLKHKAYIPSVAI